MENIENKEILQVEMNETLKKQIGFLGIIYQICGVLTIISGAMMCLGIITAVIGVPYIMGGLKLFSSGGSFSQTVRENQGEALKSALGDLAKAVKLLLIAMIVLIVFYIVIFIILMMIGIAASANGY